MGNRAVIAFDNADPNTTGVYLHWNGGRDSVESFLKATKEVMQGRLGDRAYGRARLIQVITTFINGNLSVGVGPLKELDCDNYDNGLYIVDTATMEIVGRKYEPGAEQDEYNRQELADFIKKRLDAAANVKDLDDEEKANIGNKWAEILMLKQSPEHKDRFLTTWGDKTPLGLYETLNRIVTTPLDDLPQ